MSAALQISTDDDLRRAPRERVMLSAKLIFQSGSVSLTCVATNISTTGARLSVSPDVVLAQTMRLIVPQRDVEIPVRMVWRRGSVVAVTFEQPAPFLKAPPPKASKDGLEMENRRLRLMVVQLEQRLKLMEEGY